MNKQKKKIDFLYVQPSQIISGGQKYEKDLRETLGKINDYDVKIKYLWHKKPNIFQRKLAPFIALKKLPSLLDSDIIVFNSTSFTRYMLLNLFLTQIFRKRTINIHHHYLFLEPKSLKGKIYKQLELLYLRSSKYILTPNPLIKEQTKNLIKKECLLCEIPFNIPESIDSDIKRKQNQLLYVGTIEPRKGLSYLINAIKLIKGEIEDYKLIIVGKVKDIDYYNKILKEIEDNNLNVYFSGFISDEELKKLYSESDIFVFPSLQEGFGMSLNEAMSYGLPVVCFNNSAMPYSVNETNGILVENKNSEKFSDAILKIMKDNTLRDNLSKGALQHAKNLFTKDNFEKKVKHIFSSI